MIFFCVKDTANVLQIGW